MSKIKIVISEHILKKKIPILRSQGWFISEAKIKDTIMSPEWKGVSPYKQPTVMSLMDKNHILRVVINKNDDIIFAVTIHITRRGRYESSK